jgi:hypothetical protein
MIEDYPTTSEARNQAEEYATPLDQLINPSDVVEEADGWADIDDDVIRRECAESAEVVASEHREIRNLIQDTAFRLWIEGLRRVSRDALGDAPDIELIHVFNIWPNDMDKWEMHEMAHKVYEDPNFRIPNGRYQEARGEVIAGLIEGTKPE